MSIVPTVTNIGGGLYQYSYSISSTGTDDAFLVDISVPTIPAAITNLTVPAGFTDAFDSVNGLVSFLEDTSSFTSTPTTGFFFDSPYAPGTASYVVSLLDSSANIFTISGTTTAPVVTPEPASLYLVGLMATAVGLFRRGKNASETNNHANGESI